ncbi:hypothetical protein [Arthrobacter sp. M4]|uniref:hypothetical protein n=1 Tax=Arthrobacter sp. M4 TaxID=218160 RepID=UPI001CDB868A|nr:hypothetical protein [Arthrobacter sp. M4]MCA4134122.1 hypothetical protein [Arthrobacter sp. M4]
MNKATKVFGAIFGGVLAGAALAFIMSVATIVTAIVTGSTADLPGIFSATPGSENDALAVEFQPNSTGLLLIVAATAAICGIAAALSDKKNHTPEHE